MSFTCHYCGSSEPNGPVRWYSENEEGNIGKLSHITCRVLAGEGGGASESWQAPAYGGAGRAFKTTRMPVLRMWRGAGRLFAMPGLLPKACGGSRKGAWGPAGKRKL